MTLSDNRFYQKWDQERKVKRSSRSGLDIRSEFERDYGRIIHSAAFRRLQSKKQVLGIDMGDFHRTRLTHSMETAQIARGITLSLNHRSDELTEGFRINPSLVEAAALAHDLGHPPFGHEGESALNKCMEKYGGFEGNAHTFRLLTRLEGKAGEGLNLTRGLLMGVVKYPIVYDDAQSQLNPAVVEPPKASVFSCDQDSFEWLLQPLTAEERSFYLARKRIGEDPQSPKQTLHLSFECSLIELADDIAYATHDLEDAVNLRLVDVDELREVLDQEEVRNRYEEWSRAVQRMDRLHPRQQDFNADLKKVFSDIISAFVHHIQLTTVGPPSFCNRLRYRATLPRDLRRMMDALKQKVEERVIQSPQVRTMGWKGERVVQKLFEAYCQEERLLPENDRRKIQQGPESRYRVVCDYIAGMTDPFALKMVDRLYGSTR